MIWVLVGDNFLPNAVETIGKYTIYIYHSSCHSVSVMVIRLFFEKNSINTSNNTVDGKKKISEHSTVENTNL